MPQQPVDPKREGVKATSILWEEPPIYREDDKWFGPPGAFIGNPTGESWRLCCPGCGECGSPRLKAKWTATEGDFADVATLTLSPSIAKSCCGWHGYLTKGVFTQS